jgi:glycerate 2-kinase
LFHALPAWGPDDRSAAFLRPLFDRVVDVADPMRALGRFLPSKPTGRVLAVGVGRASTRMTEAV